MSWMRNKNGGAKTAPKQNQQEEETVNTTIAAKTPAGPSAKEAASKTLSVFDELLQEERAEHEKQLNAKQQELEQARNDAASRIQQLESILKEKTDEVASLKSASQTSVAEKDREIASLKAELQTQTQARQQAEAASAASTSKQDQLTARISELETESAQLRADLKAANNQAANLVHERDQHKMDAEEAKSALANLESELRARFSKK